jgi:hypothetical protein
LLSSVIEQKEKTYYPVVDLDKMIVNSRFKLIRNTPGFLVRWMKNIICQDELNSIHKKCYHKVGIDYINAILNELNINVVMHNVEALENLDRCIFVANHPLGGIDSMSFLHCINKLKGSVVSPSNEFFKYIPNLHPLIVGVNVFGKNTREQTMAINQVFMSDVQIMIFPAGLVSRMINGKVQDMPWHKTFISKAIQTKRYVVPTWISEVNTRKFYRIAKVRKFSGVKLPVEILFLPQEMLKKRGKTIHLAFGEPKPHVFFDTTKTPHQWAQLVREEIYKIERDFSETFNDKPLA